MPVLPADNGDGHGIYALMATLEMPALKKGWNAFGYPLPEDRPVKEALASVWDSLRMVARIDPDPKTWRFYNLQVEKVHPEFAKLVNDLPMLEFGKAYWLFADQAVTPYLGVPDPAQLASDSAQVDSLEEPFSPALLYGPFTGAAAGTQIEAWLGDRLCGQSQVIDWEGAPAYRLLVEAGQENGCGSPGQVIRLVVDGQVRGYLAWDNTQAIYAPLDLTGVYQGYPMYLPLLAK